MQLVEKHIIKNIEMFSICEKSKNLYNQALYYWRQSLIGNIQYFTEYELIKLFCEFDEENYRVLPAQTSQQIIKLLFKNIKSWYKSKKEYDKNPKKFLGKPKIPKYKKETFVTIFTNQQISIKKGFIYFPKMTGIKPVKTKVNKICQVRIIPNSTHCTVEVVYEKQEKELKKDNGKWLSIDMGLNNLATCATNDEVFIINGKPLKAINHFYNKRKSKLQSLLPKNKFKSKRIDRLTNKRNNKISDYIHKASSLIIKKAVKKDITKIIIGNNKNWKQEINIGKTNNRHFTSIPHSTLIEKIQYKGKLEGIEIVLTQEAYTSKCSALDLEPICKHDTYLGKRVSRGLFKTSKGQLINADVNGSLNIARLVAGDDIISDSVRRCVFHPIITNILHTKCM